MFPTALFGTSTQRQAEPSFECKGANKNLREGKATYIIYKLSEDGASIEVDVEGASGIYDTFLAAFPLNECRWAVYAVDLWQSRSVILFFFAWTPSGATTTSKAKYAANADVVKATWKRIDVTIESSTVEEIGYLNLMRHL